MVIYLVNATGRVKLLSIKNIWTSRLSVCLDTLYIDEFGHTSEIIVPDKYLDDLIVDRFRQV